MDLRTSIRLKSSKHSAVLFHGVDLQNNTAVISNELDVAEFIDQSVWVPKGEEVIPAMMLVNRYAVCEGKSYISTSFSHVDRLLQINAIDQSQHATAMRLIHLYKLGTSRQDFAVMKMFMAPSGYDSSDFCPISEFIKATNNLRKVYYNWVRVLCGLESCTFGKLAENADLVRFALDKVAENLSDLADLTPGHPLIERPGADGGRSP